MSPKQRNWRHRARLHQVWPYCFWCECEVQLIGQPRAGPPIADAATLDHIYDRRTRERHGPDGGHVVLACWQCNNVRSWTPPLRWLLRLEGIGG